MEAPTTPAQINSAAGLEFEWLTPDVAQPSSPEIKMGCYLSKIIHTFEMYWLFGKSNVGVC
jgi:hypothetical protein